MSDETAENNAREYIRLKTIIIGLQAARHSDP